MRDQALERSAELAAPDFELSNALRQAMLDHAEREYPREACGLLVQLPGEARPHYLPAANLAPIEARGRDAFVLDPLTWADAEDAGRILAVVHSHPDGTPNPSMGDRVQCERSGVPWLVVAWPGGAMKRLDPSGWSAPLVGRTFHHGVLDCYTLIQDYYLRKLHTPLPDFERADDWWQHGGDLYRTQFERAGFVQVQGPPQLHDGLIMQWHAEVWNHAAVYVGDDVMLHHLHGTLSCHDTYGNYWRRHTKAVVRHISRIRPAEAAALLLAA